jgi:hypothetical protein
VNSAVPVPVKSIGVQLILVLPRTKIHEKYELSSTQFGIHHACMRCIAGIELHACVYELARCLKGAASSQICQSGAAISDRMASLLATDRLASVTVIMFALQNKSTPEVGGLTQASLSRF